jgi:hypothetical protein
MIKPACWRIETTANIRRLAAVNGCNGVGDISKLVEEGNLTIFAVTCSAGAKNSSVIFKVKLYLITWGSPIKSVWQIF